MSCQQVSRFITNSNNLNLNHNNNNCKILNNNIQQQQQQLNNTIKGNRNTRTIATAGGGGGLIVVQQQQQQQQEDPYVFTESVPTPPILFNTQKTRTRLNDLPSGTTLSIGKLQQQQKLPLTETNGKITLNSLKTQASYISSSAAATSSSPSITTSATTTTNTCSAAATSTFKNNVTQSLTTTTITTTTTNNCNSNKKLTNICIVRPQLQQQQPQHYQHQNYINSSTITSSVYEGDLKSISPPPLYTPPTPSLWQTPLLLESSATAGNTTSFQNNGMVMAKSLTTTTTTPTSLRCTTPTIHTSTAVGLSSSSNNTSAAATNAVTTNQTSSMTTTAMAKVAPIIVHTPTLATANTTSSSSQQSSPTTPNQCLPPSKFHNHTLAQHLQKVECLKNSKKSLELEENLPEKLPSPPSSPSAQKTAALKLATSPVKHSENEDLNEIPVNVIFRMAMVPQTNEKSSNNIQFVKPQTEIDTQTTKQVIISPTPSLTSSTATSSSSSAQQQLKTNVNKKLSTIPASKIITTTKLQQQQINTSSIQQPQQQQKQNATTTALNSQPNNNTNANNNNNNEKDETNSKTTTTTATTPTIKETLTKLTSNNSNVSITKIKNSTHISTPKTNRKLNPLNSSTTIKVSKDLSAADNGWQIDGCTTTTKGAVAIVKMSQHNIDLDTTHLATATGLPYCLQQYWLDANDYRKLSSLASSSSELLAMDNLLNRSLAREERIALYKQQLRRQAMQLLSTRSLQKLPIQIARRRLMCVDRLLRKYQQNEQNKKELPANVKRCCVNGCDAYTIELASHCQKHIVYNSAQHVFLPCTAKFADNTQCRVPVFDINHDLPLCMEHARKRDAYNRHLYEQRPRKISTNPMAINDTNLTTTTTTTTTSTKVSNNKNIVEGKVKGNNTVTGTGTGGILIKTQNYQQQQKQKQQQQQNILQQLPTNQYISSNNGNKRPTLVNQQQSRKRKMTNAITVAGAGSGGDAGFNGNPVGRPQKRVKKNTEKILNTKTNNTTATLMTTTQMPRLTTTNLKRKSSTTSLESIASNSQHSTASSTSQQPPQQQQYQRQQPQQQQQHLYGNSSLIANTTTTSSSSLPPPALAPLSGSGLLGHGLPQHLFSFGHDNHHHNHHSQQYQQQPPPQQHQPLNINDKHSFIPATATATASSSTTTTASTPTELKDFIQQFSLLTQKQNNQQSTTADKMSDINLLNTNSNSNFTSSGMGSTTSLPTADDFLTQDMLSICENSSASSADTGLGGLSDPELMLGGTEDDIPLGDTHLLEEHDLENVLNSLPEDAFKELFTAVHQDESDEIERAIELADKHLKTLQQTIGSELGDFLDFNDDMLMDNGDLCNGSTANTILDTSALFIGGGGLMGAAAAAANGSIGVPTANSAQNGGSVIGTDIRGLVQT